MTRGADDGTTVARQDAARRGAAHLSPLPPPPRVCGNEDNATGDDGER